MPLPANAGTGTVTGTFTDDDGTAAQGKVHFIPNVSLLLDASANVIVVLHDHVVTLNASGSFSQVLVATDDVDLNPLNWTWTVREEIDGKQNRHYSIAVPAGTTRDLADISPVPSSAGDAIVVGPQGPPGTGALAATNAEVLAGTLTTAWVNPAGLRTLVRPTGTNFAVGVSAQQALTTGTYNSAFGDNAQYALITGYRNTAVGFSSQLSLTMGYNNVAVGTDSQQSLTTGNNNVGVGYQAQYAPGGVVANATTTAFQQTSIGADSGQGSAVQANDITTVGYRALGTGLGATSLGSGAQAAFAGSVALGMGTVTTVADQVAVGTRDIEIFGNSTKGIVMRSPDGTRYRLRIANGGTVSITAA